jgi:arginine decarboxylase
LSEHETFGQDAKTAGDFAEELAATMLATTLGIKLDNTKAWHEKKEYLMIDGKIVKTSNVTKEAKVPKTGEWTTVVAAAVLIP